MKKKQLCCECSKGLTRDEIALTKKLLDMHIDEFYCLGCLSRYLECGQEELMVKIQEFKEQGCTLFV